MTLSYHRKKSVCVIRLRRIKMFNEVMAKKIVRFRSAQFLKSLTYLIDIVQLNTSSYNEDEIHIQLLTLIETALKMNENCCKHLKISDRYIFALMFQFKENTCTFIDMTRQKLTRWCISWGYSQTQNNYYKWSHFTFSLNINSIEEILLNTINRQQIIY